MPVLTRLCSTFACWFGLMFHSPVASIYGLYVFRRASHALAVYWSHCPLGWLAALRCFRGLFSMTPLQAAAHATFTQSCPRFTINADAAMRHIRFLLNPPRRLPHSAYTSQ